MQAAAHISICFCLRAGLQQTAVDVADGSNTIAIFCTHLGQTEAALRVDGMQSIWACRNQLIQNGNDTAIRMFDGEETHFMIFGNSRLQIGENKFGKLVVCR